MTLSRFIPTCLIALPLVTLLSAPVFAQGMEVGIGGLRQDAATPVEVTADQLSVNRQAGGAVFEGNVLVVQGALRMAAGKVDVAYGADGQGIERLDASGGVTLATATDAAESTSATYEIASGALVMSGAVLLTQGNVTIAGDRLVADLRSGTGRMEGRVKTVFQPGSKN